MPTIHEQAAERLIREVAARMTRRDEAWTVVRALGALAVLLAVIGVAFGAAVGGSVLFAVVVEWLGR